MSRSFRSRAPSTPARTWSRRQSAVSLWLGAHVGGANASGKTGTVNGVDHALSDLSGAGVGAGLDAGIRFAKYLYVGATFEASRYAKESHPVLGSTTLEGSTESSSRLFALNAAYISNPYGFGFFGEIGLGYRTYSLTTTWSQPLTGSVGAFRALGHNRGDDSARPTPSGRGSPFRPRRLSRHSDDHRGRRVVLEPLVHDQRPR